MKARLLLVAAALALTTGCSTELVVVGTAAGMPRCDPTSRYAESGAIALAQAVPTARWLPCVNLVPVGWSFRAFVPSDGSAELVFASDRYGSAALTVHLRPSCAVDGMAEVPSEYPETRRFQQGGRTGDGYVGRRHYTFTGGCIAFEFDLRETPGGAELAGEMTGALGVLDRETVARQVHDGSDGRLDLDRPLEGSR